jgi:hypothetical protein
MLVFELVVVVDRLVTKVHPLLPWVPDSTPPTVTDGAAPRSMVSGDEVTCRKASPSGPSHASTRMSVEGAAFTVVLGPVPLA